MISVTVKQLHRIIGGKIHADDEIRMREVKGLTWDSREVKNGNIFLAMPGERVDGNDYIPQAVYNGAGAVICTKEPSDATLTLADEFVCPVIWIDDAQKALNNLAKYWRGRLHAIVVGVTGSTGKTSTKDYLVAVLSQRFKVFATQGNHNNELGVPATILSADEDCEVLIVEMGMRGLGQIQKLCRIVQPTLGVVTNIGVSHMELLGSRENIALAKSELLSALPPAGVAFLNADDDMTDALIEDAHLSSRGLEVKSFGLSEGASYKARALQARQDACYDFELFTPYASQAVSLSMPGKHNVLNALAAASVGDYLGVHLDKIAQGLHSLQGSNMRLETIESPKGFTIINDAYNANPDSMKASLDILKNLNCEGHRYAVLGDMGELGEDEQTMHQEVGTYAATSGLDGLICVGKLARNIAKGAQDANMAQAVIKSFDTIEEASEYLKTILQEKDFVLLKASRFMGFEAIAKELLSND